VLADNGLNCRILGSDSGSYDSRVLAHAVEAIGYESIQKEASRLSTYLGENKNLVYGSRRDLKPEMTILAWTRSNLAD
jgi:hypothetical protein